MVWHAVIGHVIAIDGRDGEGFNEPQLFLGRDFNADVILDIIWNESDKYSIPYFAYYLSRLPLFLSW